MQQLEPKFPDQCHFVEDGVRCEKPMETLSPFCPEHKVFFSGLDNQKLIEEAARCSKEIVHLTPEKKFATTTDPAAMGRWTNYLNELHVRGYDLKDVNTALTSVSEALGIHKDIDEQLGGVDPKWKKFEKLVAGIHKMREEGQR